MERSLYNLFLLISCELIEVYCIARNTDSKCGVKVGVIHCVDKLLTVENVYVKMLSLLNEVAVKDSYKVLLSLIIITAQSIGSDREGI